MSPHHRLTTIKSHLPAVLVATTLALTAVTAHSTPDKTVQRFLGISLGSTEQIDPYQETSALDAEWAFENGQNLSVSWGIAESRSRAFFEVSHTRMDAGEYAPAATDTVTTATGTQAITALYYNLFWTPSLPLNLRALVGGGIGYSYIEFSDLGDNGTSTALYDDADAVFSAKAGLGLEYALLSNLSISALYQWVTHGDVELEGINEVSSGEFSNLDYSNLSVGLTYRF